jgi:hypothetical protein
MYSFAKLDTRQLKNLQQFEEKEGVRLLAFTPVEVKPATIPDKTLQAIQDLERDLGICLVAIK